MVRGCYSSCCEASTPGSASASAPGPELCVACKLLELVPPGWQERSAFGGSGIASLRPGCATHSALTPCPHALEKTLVSSFWESAALQLSFPGAGAKRALPQPLAGLQEVCVEHFSAATGEQTSWGLEEPQQRASVCLTPAVKWVCGWCVQIHTQGLLLQVVWGQLETLSTKARLAAPGREPAQSLSFLGSVPRCSVPHACRGGRGHP